MAAPPILAGPTLEHVEDHVDVTLELREQRDRICGSDHRRLFALPRILNAARLHSRAGFRMDCDSTNAARVLRAAMNRMIVSKILECREGGTPLDNRFPAS